MVDENNEVNTQAAVPAAEAPAQDAPVSEAPAAESTSEAPVAEAPAVAEPVTTSTEAAEAHELNNYLDAPISDEEASKLAAEPDVVVPTKEEVLAAGYSDPDKIIARQQKLADLQKTKRAEVVAAAAAPPAPAVTVDPSNTDNVDSLGTAQDAEINGANLGPRGEGVPADALVPDTRSPIEKAQDSTSTVTDNVDSRGEEQGDQPAFGPRGTNAKSSPETFRH